MNITTAFPSKFLKAADLKGHTVPVVIDCVVVEEVGNPDKPEQKPVLYFQGKDKGIVLNKINSTTISDAYGEETDDWSGKSLSLYPDKTPFNGKIVDCIRLRTPTSEPAVADGEVPF